MESFNFPEREFLATDPIIMTQEIKKLKRANGELEQQVSQLKGENKQQNDRISKVEINNELLKNLISELQNQITEVKRNIDSGNSNTVPAVPAPDQTDISSSEDNSPPFIPQPIPSNVSAPNISTSAAG